jgi:hypothetical protein
VLEIGHFVLSGGDVEPRISIASRPLRLLAISDFTIGR